MPRGRPRKIRNEEPEKAPEFLTSGNGDNKMLPFNGKDNLPQPKLFDKKGNEVPYPDVDKMEQGEFDKFLSKCRIEFQPRYFCTGFVNGRTKLIQIYRKPWRGCVRKVVRVMNPTKTVNANDEPAVREKVRRDKILYQRLKEYGIPGVM